MPLVVELINWSLPSELRPEDDIPVAYTVRTSGEGSEQVGGALLDPNAPDYVLLVIYKTAGPGETVDFSHTFDPLAAWYEDTVGVPIPDTLEWTPVAGWVDEEGFHITDSAEAAEMIPVRRAVGIFDWMRAHPYHMAAAATGIVAVGAVVISKRGERKGF